MADPPVYHPRDPNYRRRVNWGLLAIWVGLLVSLVGPLDAVFGSRYVEYFEAQSVVCTAAECSSALRALQWGAFFLVVAIAAGLTSLWIARRSRRAVVSAELLGLLGLVGWLFVAPVTPIGWLCFLSGGLLVVSGTGGLFDTGSHEAEWTFAALASAGGVLVWIGIASVAALGYWSGHVALAWFVVLVGYLVLCAPPLGWVRAHVLLAVGTFLLVVPPWLAVNPEGIGVTDVSPRPGDLPPPPPPDSPVYLADEAMFLFASLGTVAILLAAVAELACRLAPSLGRRLALVEGVRS